MSEPCFGVALGSGSARGWAHIGVLQELDAIGLRPQVVAGTSIGALVGAVYVSGQTEAFAEWVRKLTVRDVFGLMDFTLSGGVVKGEKLFGFFQKQHQNPDIETLNQRFVSVATDMACGREVWIDKGPVLAAARISCALPGVLRPVQHEGRWMLDGGLVNPVPVSAARAAGAELVLAVNLNAQLVGRHFSREGRAAASSAEDRERGFWQKVMGFFESDDDQPSMFDVIAASINIMQDRITTGRMTGDPPDIMLAPRLADFAMMDFHRAEEAIAEGRALVRDRADEIRARVRAGAPREAIKAR
ncbi:MAG: patatin-like phospholipase family protein [Gammaproteobacteria bacterium]|nr:patatin-like phospholipase family protein [Gammaproteobacteria bacterium]